MNQLVFIENNRLVTDSLTVAETFGKEHARVLRDIRELGCSEEFRVGNFALSSYNNSQNKSLPKYFITEQGFALLVMGYTGQSAMEFKEKYISEFHRMRDELDKHPQKRLPQNYKEALLELVSQVEENERLTAQLELQAPKVEMYDILLSGDNSQTMNQVAKVIGTGRNKLFAFLRAEGVLMASNMPYQQYMDRDLFEVREVSTVRGDKTINVTQTMVTPKGVDFIAKLFSEA